MSGALVIARLPLRHLARTAVLAWVLLGAFRHLAKALGLWEAGIAGATAIAPLIATAIIDSVGVATGFMPC